MVWRWQSKNKKRAAQDRDNPVQTDGLGGELIVCIAVLTQHAAF